MSFYGRMASTASRLLTQYGKTIVLERITSVFNPVTGKDTSRTVAESTTTGVEIPIRDALVDGTRVKVGDRFFIIDSSFAPAMGDRLQDSPSISCAYPLNMTQAQAISIGASDLLPSTGQLASYTLSAGDTAGSLRSFSTGPDLSAPQIVDISQGKKAVECVLNTRQLISDGAASSVIQFFNPADSSLIFRVGALRNNLSLGGDDILVVDQLGIVNSTPIAASDSHVVGCVFDSTTGTYSVTVDGVVVSLLRDSYTASNAVILLGASYEFVSKDPADNDKVFSVELRTSASDMTGTYPSGTTDICGNQIGYPQISQSWAIVAIEPISPAGVPVAYRLQVRK